MTRSRTLYALLLLSPALLLNACVTHIGKPDSTSAPAPMKLDYVEHLDQRYTPPDWPKPLYADLYVPKGVPPPQGWPAVVVLYGGGWRSGDRDQLRSIAKRVARRGYVTMDIEYRLVPDYQFPAPLQDVQQAVRWLRAHAVDYGVDTQHIGAWGYSAGAHLAALLGSLSPGDPNFAEGTRIQTVIAGGTPADLRKFHGGTLVPNFLGEHWSEDSAIFKAASPAAWVSPDDPPVFLYHGSWDRLVPPDQAEDYQKLLDAAGLPNQLYMLRGLGHISTFLFDYYAVGAGIDFLDRHLRAPAVDSAEINAKSRARIARDSSVP